MPFPEIEDGSPVSHRQINWSLLDQCLVSDSGGCSYFYSNAYRPSMISQIGQDFIRRLLQHEPSARMSASEACEHPWLANERRDLDSSVSPSIRK